MIIGVPREIKPGEHRVAITPVGVRELIGRGHRVVIETRAGEGSTIHDVEYEDQGGEIAASARDVFEIAELILKVKELQPPEVAMLHRSEERRVGKEWRSRCSP